MVPTRTTVLLLALALVVWLVALALSLLPTRGPLTLSPDLLLVSHWLVLGFDGCLLLLLAGDVVLAWRASRPGRLTVRRERPARLSLGVANEVGLILENRANHRLRLLVRDAPPPTFSAEPALLEADVPAHGRCQVLYRLL